MSKPSRPIRLLAMSRVCGMAGSTRKDVDAGMADSARKDVDAGMADSARKDVDAGMADSARKDVDAGIAGMVGWTTECDACSVALSSSISEGRPNSSAVMSKRANNCLR